jgi:catechol 2,3-dioxygenase-like lactoylglutathione lyase family enzyme
MPSLKTKITTGRFADTRAFYESLFGLAVVEEWDEPGDKGVILQLPGGHREALLELYDGEGTDDFVGPSLQFRVDDLESFVAKSAGRCLLRGAQSAALGIHVSVPA